MARPLRLALAGAVYHVISRGNDRQTVFGDLSDRELFFEVLAHAVERYGWLCHTYCLMGNHYHLLLETPKPTLSIGMRQVNGLYARRFNLRHGRCGHLFQARFSSILVQKESHLLEASRYIVLNPVRARLCAHPEQSPWSSYRALAGQAPAAPFLCTDVLLGQFGKSRASAQAAYRKFVEEGIADANEEQVRGERLGEEAFLRERFGLDPPLAEIPRVQVEPLRRPLAEIFAASAEPVAAAYRQHGYTLREIGEYLGCHYSTVSRRLHWEEEVLLQCKT
jgi:REP-associated tyrosine transposase